MLSPDMYQPLAEGETLCDGWREGGGGWWVRSGDVGVLVCIISSFLISALRIQRLVHPENWIISLRWVTHTHITHIMVLLWVGSRFMVPVDFITPLPTPPPPVINLSLSYYHILQPSALVLPIFHLCQNHRLTVQTIISLGHIKMWIMNKCEWCLMSALYVLIGAAGRKSGLGTWLGRTWGEMTVSLHFGSAYTYWGSCAY